MYVYTYIKIRGKEEKGSSGMTIARVGHVTSFDKRSPFILQSARVDHRANRSLDILGSLHLRGVTLCWRKM